MRIVFWGNERGCHTTSNMLILAGYLACQCGYRITLMELAVEKTEIKQYFSKPWYYYVKKEIETLMKYRLYYVRRENYLGNEQITYLEQNMDLVFLNLANRMDEEARTLMHNADLVVVNLKQEQRAFDLFYAGYANLSARMFLLVGNYYRMGSSDREFLQEYYGAKSEQTGIILNNPEYEMACEKGILDRYMYKSSEASISGRKHSFFREIERTAELLIGSLV